MTPSNPNNDQPFIYRIADALGITHLVVAVQHSHLMSEIEGLVSALAGKMDAKTIDSVPTNNADHLVSSKGVYDALMAINNLRSITSYGSAVVHAEAGNNPLVQIALQRTGETLVDAKITLANIANLNRALDNPDSTPTVGSDNLVTSGGVKGALDGKAAKVNTDVQYFPKSYPEDLIDLQSEFEDGHDQSTFILENHSQETYNISDFFEEDSSYRVLYPTGTLPNILEDGVAVVKVINTTYGGDPVYIVVPEAYYVL